MNKGSFKTILPQPDIGVYKSKIEKQIDFLCFHKSIKLSTYQTTTFLFLQPQMEIQEGGFFITVVSTDVIGALEQVAFDFLI